MRKPLVALIVAVLLAFAGGSRLVYPRASPDTLTAHFIDVDQGNATLLVGPDCPIVLATFPIQG